MNSEASKALRRALKKMREKRKKTFLQARWGLVALGLIGMASPMVLQQSDLLGRLWSTSFLIAIAIWYQRYFNWTSCWVLLISSIVAVFITVASFDASQSSHHVIITLFYMIAMVFAFFFKSKW